ncbi:tyrosine recombinase [Cohnella cellulosilytica]|uniref:Tyrosine recombinase n=1 Tax=Cohnella cellulosilytica TaxID=986710 RepID=A0ABW2F679_9BACL
MDLKDLLQAYLAYLKEDRGVAPVTEQSYLSDLSDFLGFLDKQRVGTAADLRARHLTAYLNELRAQGRASSTIARRVAALRSFCKFLVLRRYVDADPAIQLETPRAEPKTPKTIRTGELDELLELPDVGQAAGIRDRAMLELLYATGLRVSELASLDADHVRLDMGFLLCLGSDGRERMVPVGASGNHWVSKYVEEVRPKLLRPEKRETALFLNRQGSRLTRQGIWKILKGYADRLGMDATPQALRRSFASHLLENGADLRAVQEMLGVTSAASLQPYLSAAKPRLTEVYERSHPRSGRKPGT